MLRRIPLYLTLPVLVLSILATLAVAQPAAIDNKLDRSVVPIVDANRLRTLRETIQPLATPIAGGENGVDTVVLCPPVFRQSLAAWVRYRTLQGHGIRIVDGNQPSRILQSTIRQLATAHPLRYVVIIGDADPAMATDAEVRARCVPTFYGEARVNKKWGSEPFIATDNPYGDLDDDQVPELAVGRISCDSARQLTTIIDKTICYETELLPGLWRRQIHLVAGIGGFGALADAAIEGAAKKFITDMIPPEYVTSVTYGSWRSPFCPDPRCFREAWLERVNSGGLFWVYMGHGNPNRLDHLTFGDSSVPVLEPEDVDQLQSAIGPPIAVLLACYTGAFDQPDDCIAEEMVRTPHGPVAVLCGSRVTMPYGMAVFATSLMEAYFQEKTQVLGDAFLKAKRAMASESSDHNPNRKLLDAIALALSPIKDELPKERHEHLLLFQLLGDPLLVTVQPATVAIDCRRHAEAGRTIQVRGQSPIGGKCLIELACRRDRLTTDAPRRKQWSSAPTSLTAMNAVYARANDQRWTGRRVDIKPGVFVAELVVPQHAEGSSHVRIFVEGDQEFAVGSAPVFIQAAKDDDVLRTINTQR